MWPSRFQFSSGTDRKLETDPGERYPVEDKALMWKLRGMVAMFQDEMRLTARTAGQLSPSFNAGQKLKLD